MTQTAAVFTTEAESAVAGQDLGRQIRDALGQPDAVIVFASSRYDHASLLRALHETCQPRVMVGASSAGEFTDAHHGESSACAMAIQSTDMRFASGIGHGVSTDRVAAAREVVTTFEGMSVHDLPYRGALVLTDALAGHADDLLEQLTIATSGLYELAGGGAGDDQLTRTVVFRGVEVASDAVVALEIRSHKPLGVGVQHGWTPASEPLRITEVDGARIVSIDGFPAVEAFEQHAELTGQRLERDAPLPFFLHNILGIDTPGGYRLRVPLSIDRDGAVVCAAEIPSGARVHIMKTSSASATEAASEAARSAVRGLRGGRPAAALFFDCVATRLRMGDVFGFELEAVRSAIGDRPLVGCNTYGQLARAEGQFAGFHNCTAVVLAFPD
ncbi:MAG TPA: FIST N-terminal domain-containing protein [Kofleriaceae bacterium]|nr:FIST N-terminal domain-containing protein [Kofleriaceae bacterium]